MRLENRLRNLEKAIVTNTEVCFEGKIKEVRNDIQESQAKMVNSLAEISAAFGGMSSSIQGLTTGLHTSLTAIILEATQYVQDLSPTRSMPPPTYQKAMIPSQHRTGNNMTKQYIQDNHRLQEARTQELHMQDVPPGMLGHYKTQDGTMLPATYYTKYNSKGINE